MWCSLEELQARYSPNLLKSHHKSTEACNIIPACLKIAALVLPKHNVRYLEQLCGLKEPQNTNLILTSLARSCNHIIGFLMVNYPNKPDFRS